MGYQKFFVMERKGKEIPTFLNLKIGFSITLEIREIVPLERIKNSPYIFLKQNNIF